jgi:hypothetical protein
MQLANHFEVAINYPKVVADPGLSSSLVNADTEIAGVLELVDLAPRPLPRADTPLLVTPIRVTDSLAISEKPTITSVSPAPLCGEAFHRNRF